MRRKSNKSGRGKNQRPVAEPNQIPTTVRRIGETFIPISEATNAVVLRLSSRFPRIRCERRWEEEDDAALAIDQPYREE